MVNSTDFTKVTPSSENYLKSIDTGNTLKTEDGDDLVLEDGTTLIATEDTGLNSTSYSSSTVNSTNYS